MSRTELDELRQSLRTEQARLAEQEAEVGRRAAEYAKLAAYTAEVEREATATHAAYAALHGELIALQRTKLMRWSAPLRDAAARVRANLPRRAARS
jgi:chromosome segregation ATPase